MRYKKDQKFISKENWKDIKRGWIHEAVIPFTAERPLDFFIPYKNDDKKGTIISGLGNFVPSTIQKAVFELKQRKVLILSSDEICSDQYVHDVTVAPIYGIYQEDKFKDWCKKVIDGTHPFFAYLPKEVTGMECLVDLTNVVSIGKNMLLIDKCDINDRMNHIENILESCLSLGIYKKSKQETDELPL